MEDPSQQGSRQQRLRLKRAPVSFLPDLPSNQHHDGIKSPSTLLWKALASPQPPFDEVIVERRRQLVKPGNSEHMRAQISLV